MARKSMIIKSQKEPNGQLYNDPPKASDNPYEIPEDF